MAHEAEVNRRQFVSISGAALATGLAKSAPAVVPSAPMNAKDRQFLCGDGLRNATQDGRAGYVVKVRLTDYRSLPLSCILGVELSVDGIPVDSKDLTLTLNGYTHKLASLGSMTRATWWVLDPADLFVPGAHLASGEHEIAGTLIFLLPYATAGAITLRASSKKRLKLEEVV